jgi:hypothetical protein
VLEHLDPTGYALLVKYRNTEASAEPAAAAIPDWATKDEEWILDWLTTNIGTPLAAPIPAAPMTAAQIRGTFVTLVAIMDKMYLAEKSSARMVIALRNKSFRHLQE